MTRVDTRQRRPRGLIDKLPSGRLRVRVYTGYDPVTKRRHYTVRLCQSGGPNRRP
jgi:integrase